MSDHSDQNHGVFGVHDHARELHHASRRGLTIALALIGGYMVVQAIGGILSGSLVLLAGTAHMLIDSAALAVALATNHFASKAPTAERTFGYHRLEVMAALLNALVLCVVAVLVMVEAYRRIAGDGHGHVEGGLMLIVGVIGLVVHIAASAVLWKSARHSVGVEGALRHVLADLMSAVAVVISGVLVLVFHWTLADPILSVIVGVLILIGSWRLMSKVFHVLLQGTPPHIDVYSLCSQMEAVESITLIHDIHVWTLVPGYDSMTAHALIDPDYQGDPDLVLQELRRIAIEEFGIHHVTIQIDRSLKSCSEHHHVDHLLASSRVG